MAKKSPYTIWIIFALVVLGILYFTGNLDFVFGENNNCRDIPTDPNCYCPEGYYKMEADYAGGFYLCVPVNAIINLSEPDDVWQAQILEYSLQRFDADYPICDMRNRLDECTDRLELVWMFSPSDPSRIIGTFSCRESINGGAFELARCWFNIDDGSIWRVGDEEQFYCYDEDGVRHPIN